MAQEEQQAQLRQAMDAAVVGDSAAYFKALAVSHVLDGLVHRMGKRWPAMDADVIHNAVAEAADSLFRKLSGGGVVSSAPAYLWKAAFNQVMKIHEARSFEVEYDDQNESHALDEDGQERDREPLRNEALRFARSLLPRLGGDNFQKVMGFILDCVEQREFHVENEQISEATGISLVAVRRLKSRGFQRLRREAAREGIELGREFEPDEEEFEDSEMEQA